MQSTISARGQTVIPRQIREELKITSDTVLEWKIKNGVMIVLPIPNNPVQASVGILKDQGLSTADLLEERQVERERE